MFSAPSQVVAFLSLSLLLLEWKEVDVFDPHLTFRLLFLDTLYLYISCHHILSPLSLILAVIPGPQAHSSSFLSNVIYLFIVTFSKATPSESLAISTYMQMIFQQRSLSVLESPSPINNLTFQPISDGTESLT